MLKINFFTPTFNRTGSEIALFNLINHASGDFSMRVFSDSKGELTDNLPSSIQFIETGPLVRGYSNSDSRLVRAANRVLSRKRSPFQYLEDIHENYPADLWYVNTISQPGIVSFAVQHNIPLVVHAHELEQMFPLLSAEQLAELCEYPRLMITCSETCRNVYRHSGRKKEIEVIYPGIDFSSVKSSDDRIISTRKKLDFAEGTFVWTMSGTMDPNKNASAFVDIAALVLKENAGARFMWLSNGFEESAYALFCRNKADTLGIGDKITWAPRLREEYYDYFAAADGFVLTSLRESFSMVTAEALFLGKPVASFDCGGVKEIVNGSTGIVVNDHDKVSIVKAMLSIMDKKAGLDLSSAPGSVRKFDALVVSESWKKIMQKYFPLK